MEQTHKSRRRIITLATAIFTIMIVGVAFAAWTAIGDGTGTATAGVSADLDIDPVSAGTLYPNTSKDLTVEITNPNEFNVTLLTIDEDDENAIEASGDCDASSVTFKSGGYSYTAGDEIVSKDDGTLQVTLVDALTMDNGDEDCKGETFTVHLELTGESTAANPTS